MPTAPPPPAAPAPPPPPAMAAPPPPPMPRHTVFPPPPRFTERYTDDNLQTDAERRRVHADGHFVPPLDPPLPPLAPPPVPTTGTYRSFGRTLAYARVLATLEQNPTRAVPYPHAPTLAAVDHLKTILLNLQHLTGQFRPHQALETLALAMEKQVLDARAAGAQVQNAVDGARRVIDTVAGLKPAAETVIPPVSSTPASADAMALDVVVEVASSAAAAGPTAAGALDSGPGRPGHGGSGVSVDPDALLWQRVAEM
ncbi:hypothetical protein AMAG_04275 [Allomyces macrogynus ATCC 38327]|uniref:Mediator of RNA polymerase II transcription subunit 7 n=1 Tax=Allomyces macrogynus (strain ATCC 38327) TaxID=578462 RepID=A0A0L0S7Z3_ALLM3|nr:hypothetical protein AMAG_04275 [Allomyces macrogynus ATCC 38327]|eukprot:KNE58723.1 hypothetical protein AMAG_04275 [Allomyces macrogynus ATCC 38327]